MSNVSLDLQHPTSVLISVDNQPFYTVAYNQNHNSISLIYNDPENVARTEDINWLLDNVFDYAGYVTSGLINFKQMCGLLDYDVFLINSR